MEMQISSNTGFAWKDKNEREWLYSQRFIIFGDVIISPENENFEPAYIVDTGDSCSP